MIETHDHKHYDFTILAWLDPVDGWTHEPTLEAYNYQLGVTIYGYHYAPPEPAVDYPGCVEDIKYTLEVVPSGRAMLVVPDKGLDPGIIEAIVAHIEERRT